MNQIRQRTQTNTRPYFTCGGLSSEEMKKQIEMYDGDMIAIYEETQELKDAVFNDIIEWCKRHDVSSGESFQNDEPQIYAPILLANIIDKRIKFKTEWKDQSQQLTIHL